MSKRCLLIFGPFRSGTSLLARIMACLGYASGPLEDLFAPSPWNPAGYMQRPDVTLFNTRVIEHAGGSIAVPPSPEHIVRSVPSEMRRSIDLDWTQPSSRVLIKDPRFCATALYWIKSGLLDGFEIELLHISRDIENTARSCLSHYDVKRYVHGTLSQARTTIKLYDNYAEWLLRNVRHRSLHVHYEDFLLEPAATVRRLASFAECRDGQALTAALAATEDGQSVMSGEGEPPL